MVSRENKLLQLAELWLTTAEVAELFGLTPASVRTNFPRYYGVRPQNDLWRRSDIQIVNVMRQVARSRPKTRHAA